MTQYISAEDRIRMREATDRAVALGFENAHDAWRAMALECLQQICLTKADRQIHSERGRSQGSHSDLEVAHLPRQMNHIPKALNEELNADPFYLKCCLRFLGGCSGRIERHHNLIYAGRQYQAKFAILPACHDHHDQARKMGGVMVTGKSNGWLMQSSQ